MDCGEAAAFIESIVSYARHALGDGDGGEAAATRESIVSNARHALGDVDGREAAAIRESTASNARHAILHPLVSDGGGDGDGARVLRATRTFNLGLLDLRDEVVPDAVDLDCFGTRPNATQQHGCHEQEMFCFSHNT